jgi:hypothetical protein
VLTIPKFNQQSFNLDAFLQNIEACFISKCSCGESCTNSITFSRLPEVILIKIEHDENQILEYNLGNVQITNDINSRYDLVAMVVNNSIPFETVCQNSTTQNWYLFKGGSVERLEQAKVLTYRPYLIGYRRTSKELVEQQFKNLQYLNEKGQKKTERRIMNNKGKLENYFKQQENLKPIFKKILYQDIKHEFFIPTKTETDKFKCIICEKNSNKPLLFRNDSNVMAHHLRLYHVDEYNTIDPITFKSKKNLHGVESKTNFVTIFEGDVITIKCNDCENYQFESNKFDFGKFISHASSHESTNKIKGHDGLEMMSSTRSTLKKN